MNKEFIISFECTKFCGWQECTSVKEIDLPQAENRYLQCPRCQAPVRKFVAEHFVIKNFLDTEVDEVFKKVLMERSLKEAQKEIAEKHIDGGHRIWRLQDEQTKKF